MAFESIPSTFYIVNVMVVNHFKNMLYCLNTVRLYVLQFCMFEVLTYQLLMQGVKGGHPRPSNIGDLFSEGSLNPYADDPYAFD